MRTWRPAALTTLGAAVPAWWVGMALSPAFRRRFELDPANRAVLDAYLPSDLVLLTGGSLLAARLHRRHDPRARAATAAVAAAWATTTLTLAGWVALRRHGRHGWQGLPPMIAGTAIAAAATTP